MSEHNIFIAVGSNIGPQENIERALIELNSKVSIISISNFYKTAAVDRPDQSDFLNGVIKIKTDIEPYSLKFDILRNIEDELGRVRTADKFAARTIDLDIILYGNLVINVSDLILPDPAIRRYPFVAIPLLELAPELTMPDSGTQLWAEPAAKDRAGLELDEDFTSRLRRLILE